MICEDLVAIWEKCDKEVRKDKKSEKIMSKRDKICVVVIIVAFVVLVIAYGTLIAGYEINNDAVNIARYAIIGVMLLALLIASRILDRPKDVQDQIMEREEHYRDVLNRFIRKVEIVESELSVIEEIIKEYVCHKESNRKIVVSRAFSVCISGILVSGFGFLVQHLDGTSIDLMMIITLVCIACAIIAFTAGPLWDCWDYSKKYSLLNAKDMLNGLRYNRILSL